LPEKPLPTRKVQLTLPLDVYERFMRAVVSEGARTGSMKGAVSECAIEAIELWLKQKEPPAKKK
jgi:hypothetical protein